MDKIDNLILSELKSNSRVSITTLALKLNLSRITVRSRMERLTENGTIEAFTIKLSGGVQSNRIRAIMMYKVDHFKSASLGKALSKIIEIVEMYSTNGQWDAVAILEAANMTRFDEVLREICTTPGIVGSETNILLKPLHNASLT